MILIVLPGHNESETIETTFNEIVSVMEQASLSYHIYFVDDHSTDTTIQKIKEIQNDNISYISNTFEQGKGRALKCGYVIASSVIKFEDTDLVCFIDADGQIDAKDIITMINTMGLYTADAVIGNKRHPYSNTQYSLKRKIVSKTYNYIVRKLFGFDYKDTQAGIKIFKNKAIDRVIQKVNTHKYAFDVELMVALLESGHRIADCPIRVNRQKNAGSVSISSIITTFRDTLSIWIKKKKGFYKWQE